MSGIFAGAGWLIVYGGLYFNVSTTALVTIELFFGFGGTLCLLRAMPRASQLLGAFLRAEK